MGARLHTLIICHLRVLHSLSGSRYQTSHAYLRVLKDLWVCHLQTKILLSVLLQQKLTKGLWCIRLSSSTSLPLALRPLSVPWLQRTVNESLRSVWLSSLFWYCVLFCLVFVLESSRGPRFSLGVMEWAGFNYCWRAGTKGYPTKCDLIWHWTLKLRIMDHGTRYNCRLQSQNWGYRI